MTSDGRGARVTHLRHLLTLTQGQLAEKADLLQPTLSAIERGRTPLTEGIAFRICRATGTPMEFFDFGAPAYGSTEIHFRKSKRVSARGRDFVIQAFKEIERVAEQIDTAPLRLRRTKLSLAEEADIVSDADIEAFAAEVRRESGVDGDAPVRNVMRTMERAGIGIAPLEVPHGTDNEALLHGHCGMSRWGDESSRAIVTYVAGMPGDRLRFTLAHELGHILMHTRRVVPDEEQREREADRFAGAFLVPPQVAERSISETLTLHGFMRLKAQFGISIQALIMRGRKSGLISQQRQRSLMIQVSSRGWRTQEPVKVTCETPMLLWTQLSAIHGGNPYFPASTAYGVPVDLLKQWVPERKSKEPSTRQQTEASIGTVTALNTRRR
ncbi:Zn-dependent peptidase ImmA (M78 family) [Arthrobacter sp. SLBN-53]|nr:Zn-dependent peptidase ImmA (M78 family) [Arthrobacter sp. SLBN-53]